MSEGYNGWSNYETWCVSMWLDNDEGTYNYVRALVEFPRNVHKLADLLKGFVEDMPEVVAVTEGPATFVVDLLGAALSEVDWQEIATNLIEETKEY